MSSKITQTVAVAGCKGGTGKTLLAVNLAISLLKKGLRVTLMDGNLSVPDVCSSLGLDGGRDSSVDGGMPVGVRHGPFGLQVLSSMDEPGWRECTGTEHAVEMINSVEHLASSMDTLVIDTAPGLSPENVALIQAAGDIVVLLDHERPSLLDAARMVRVLYWVYGVRNFNVVVNMANSRRFGVGQFEMLQSLLTEEVGVVLRYLGAVPFDRAVSLALENQRALMEASPNCKAARAIDQIADQVSALPASPPRGRIEFFLPTRIKEGV